MCALPGKQSDAYVSAWMVHLEVCEETVGVPSFCIHNAQIVDATVAWRASHLCPTLWGCARITPCTELMQCKSSKWLVMP